MVRAARFFGLAVALTCLVAPAVLAQDETAADLVGTWKREDGKLYRLDLDPQTGELAGKMLNPPAADEKETRFYAVELRLRLEGKKVEGRATWIEPNPDAKKKPGAPESWSADARWELALVGPGKLKGRTEWLVWATGQVDERGFEEHSFERLPVLSLGSGAAPDKVDPAGAIDPAALEGTWRTAQGAHLAFKTGDAGITVERVGGEGAFPAIKLANDAGVLRGAATWEGGVETKIELALKAPGRLEGRTERAEGEKLADRGWVAWSLDRLPRVDAGVGADPGPLPAGAIATLPLELKRDDGLYLKLTAVEAGGYEGDLVSRTDGVRAHVVLRPGEQNHFQGEVVFKVDGQPVTAKWELSNAGDGTVSARCEWVDWDPAAKKLVAAGLVGRKFRALRRLG